MVLQEGTDQLSSRQSSPQVDVQPRYMGTHISGIEQSKVAGVLSRKTSLAVKPDALMLTVACCALHGGLALMPALLLQPVTFLSVAIYRVLFCTPHIARTSN